MVKKGFCKVVAEVNPQFQVVFKPDKRLNLSSEVAEISMPVEVDVSLMQEVDVNLMPEELQSLMMAGEEEWVEEELTSSTRR